VGNFKNEKWENIAMSNKLRKKAVKNN
jgi:hypothetical protein